MTNPFRPPDTDLGESEFSFPGAVPSGLAGATTPSEGGAYRALCPPTSDASAVRARALAVLAAQRAQAALL